MHISERAVMRALLSLLLMSGAALAADRSAVVMPVPGQPFFVQLAPIFVPVIDKDSVSRQVSIAVAVEIADGAQAPTVEEKRPALNDAFLSDIYAFVQQRGGIGSPQGASALKERLRTTAARVLQPVAVKEVEIEEFFEQGR
jgi:flagellar basal body-associated protein FliL